MQVSVIVLTYKPNIPKLLSTLRSVICQKDVEFELILADDGSPELCFDQAEAFLKANGFSDYRLVANPVNKGTVQNCISGLQAAQGQYVFFTSPGDLLFDARALSDFYRFAREREAVMCFGNAVHYDCGQDGPVQTSPYTLPQNPEIFNPNRSLAFRKACYCNRNWITGAVFFRERTAALRYFTAIAQTSVYTEDTPSTLFAMAQQCMPVYLSRNMIWYESGGISTGGNSKWTALIDQDIRNSVELLKKQYPRDPYVDVAWVNATEENRHKRILRKLLCHPLVMLRAYWAKFAVPATELVCTQEDMQYLRQLLRSQSD